MTAAALTPAELAELGELLRFPSISADPARAGDVRAAAEWLAALLRRGGEARVVERAGRPIVDAVVRASGGDAPTVLCYGHFDVQSPAPLELWDGDPFEPEVRDGWLYARGVADDKGQLWALVRAALDLAAEGALPVDVRFCLDSEEEVGGTSILDYLEENAGDARACVIFDTAMLDDETPVLTVATRGTLYLHLEARTGARDLHSGAYGGAALNALHVLVDALANVLPRDGRLPDALLAGVERPAADELRSWEALPPGSGQLAAQGAVAADAGAGDEFYLRTWALPSLDVNGIEGGSPVLQRTIVTSTARANLSLRLVPGQTVAGVAPVVEQLLRRGLPDGAELDVTVAASCDAGRTQPGSPAIRLALDAFERATGKRPLVLRSGGSLPIMPLLERLGIPAVVSGFDVPSGNVHAPNERMRLTSLAAARATARELFTAFAEL
ncbi:MAG TPA: M20/M25/M40 family metallo-hydrolase [Gaiellaceae bacterium]|jgi:acetylornithine deacetylase/succinyl-diaminopimelate desuccinylase-like protein|nr:M20/M25/M40 family metallo-hydrolase [Gaiellaceae bacterium]